MPQAGDTIDLGYQLHDGDATKFVRATVSDDQDNPIAGSPFTLTQLSQGFYTTNAAIMPSGVAFVRATYDVFNDAGFTIQSPDHFSGGETFELTVPDTVIDSKLDQIISLSNAILQKAFGGVISGVVSAASKLRTLVVGDRAVAAIAPGDDDIDGQTSGDDIGSHVSGSGSIDSKLDC